jgi:transcriptional regulator with XRE-family HTH domain
MAINRTPFTVKVGQQINERRRAQGLRTMEMAYQLGTSQITVERHLRGDSMLTAEQIAEYAGLLGCTTDELIPRKQQKGAEWVARESKGSGCARPERLELPTFWSDPSGQFADADLVGDQAAAA